MNAMTKAGAFSKAQAADAATASRAAAYLYSYYLIRRADTA